jgi:hypothetical protein
MFTQILKLGVHSVAQMVANPACHTNFSWASCRLNARGDIHAIPEEVAALEHDVANIDTHAEMHFSIFRQGHICPL